LLCSLHTLTRKKNLGQMKFEQTKFKHANFELMEFEKKKFNLKQVSHTVLKTLSGQGKFGLWSTTNTLFGRQFWKQEQCNLIVWFSINLIAPGTGSLCKERTTLKAAVSNTRPANIRKNVDFKRNIGPIGLFSQKKFLHFLMRPTRPCFQSLAALETLWVWDPALKEIQCYCYLLAGSKKMLMLC